MRVSGDSLCFCNGGGKSERVKASIYTSMSDAMVRLRLSFPDATATSPFSLFGDVREVSATGFLIHQGLLLTTHASLPSVSAAAQSAEARLQNGAAATLFPHRFFITSSVLDLTIVSIDTQTSNSGRQSSSSKHRTHVHKTPNLNLGSTIYLLGHTRKEDELTIAEGRVLIATDTLIKFSTNNAVSLSPGSAGFDSHGNLAFIACHPMKLSPSNTTKTSTSWNGDVVTFQFGIPIPVIYDRLLNQHWENGLVAEKTILSKTDHPSHHHFSCPVGSRVRDEDTTIKPSHLSSGMIHAQGIPAPLLYESPRLTSVPIQMKDALGTLLGISINSSDTSWQPKSDHHRGSSEETATVIPVKTSTSSTTPKQNGKSLAVQISTRLERPALARIEYGEPEIEEVGSSMSVNNHDGLLHSEVESSSPPPPPTNVVVSSGSDRDNSEVETMYSAETAESSNCRSQNDRATRISTHQVTDRSRDDDCVDVNHGGRAVVHKYPVVVVVGGKSAGLDDGQRSLTRRSCSGASTSQRCSDYFTPTVSSSTRKKMSGKVDQSRLQGSVPIGGSRCARSLKRSV